MAKFFLALLMMAVAASPAAAEPRTPTSRWVVNYDDAQCVASRGYGTKEKPLVLALKGSPRATVMRILIIRDGPSPAAEQHAGTLQFGDTRATAVSALIYGDRDTKQHVTSVNLPMTVFAANRGATLLSIKGRYLNEQLSVPGLSGIAAAFDDCLANLRDAWNVGEPHSARVAQAAAPIKPLGRLFDSWTYPAQATREGSTGKVALSLLIDEAGNVRDCMIEETSGYATLDTMSCYVISSKAKFSPAVGVNGKPVKSAYFQRIAWRMAQ